MSQPGHLLEQAFAHFQRGDLPAAEAILLDMPGQPSALHLLGVLRVRQRRLPEAAELLSRSIELEPREAQSRFNLGKVLGALGRHGEAVESLEAALALDPMLTEAALPLGRSLHALRRFDEAAAAYRQVLAARPDHAAARLALADALIAAGRPEDAEPVLTAALARTSDRKLSADLHQALVLAQRKRRPAEALGHLDKAMALDPARAGLSSDRAALLEEMQRFDDAKAAYEDILAREPVNAKAHQAYNELLYRLGDDAQFLASYARAPRTRELMLARAQFLLGAERPREAETAYRDAAARYGEDRETSLGIGLSLVKAGRLPQAVAILEDAARRHPDDAAILCNLSGALCEAGDPAKAHAMAAAALSAEPGNQVALALLGTSWRLMGDERDEDLNGHDEFVRVFDLDPPAGFADMAEFNAALLASLEGLHPPVREYLRQSLRGGTQTSDNLFGAGHDLVERLRTRILEAVGRYVAELRSDERHPYLSRKTDGFRFAGSWSSRLRDKGFHINHLHPGGWISSCYYVDLPPAVQDEAGRQGWIKFGEPSFKTGLAVRRAIQPRAGRLVLFPSYAWHGTVPFHDSHARTTIAFDVVPG